MFAMMSAYGWVQHVWGTRATVAPPLITFEFVEAAS
jgi:hypothetical protein